jgi:hypothetical protein
MSKVLLSISSQLVYFDLHSYQIFCNNLLLAFDLSNTTQFTIILKIA